MADADRLASLLHFCCFLGRKSFTALHHGALAPINRLRRLTTLRFFPIPFQVELAIAFGQRLCAVDPFWFVDRIHAQAAEVAWRVRTVVESPNRLLARLVQARPNDLSERENSTAAEAKAIRSHPLSRPNRNHREVADFPSSIPRGLVEVRDSHESPRETFASVPQVVCYSSPDETRESAESCPVLRHLDR